MKFARAWRPWNAPRAARCATGLSGTSTPFGADGPSPRACRCCNGDLNPTNVLTPVGRETPLYFLDRQPFTWSLTYGVAASDLAYFMIPWWPEHTRQACEAAVLRRWYDALQAPGYGWRQAQADWRLSVEQCLNVPMEWCSKPDTLEAMQWLWRAQFARVQNALGAAEGGHAACRLKQSPQARRWALPLVRSSGQLPATPLHTTMHAADLLGTWSLESCCAQADDGTEIQPYGDNPKGSITYTAAGYMTAALMRSGRTKFASSDLFKGTAEEVREAFEGFEAYAGSTGSTS